MSFLTADEQRAIRLRGSIKVPIEGIDKTIRVVQMSAGRHLEMVEKKGKQIAATKAAGEAAAEAPATAVVDPTEQKDLFLWMLQAACTDDSGNLFSPEDAQQLFDLLRLDEISNLVNKISSIVGQGAAKPPSEPSPVAA